MLYIKINNIKHLLTNSAYLTFILQARYIDLIFETLQKSIKLDISNLFTWLNDEMRISETFRALGKRNRISEEPA